MKTPRLATSLIVALLLVVVGVGALPVRAESCDPAQTSPGEVCNGNQVATWYGDQSSFNLDWTPVQDGTLTGCGTARELRSFVPSQVPAGTYTVTAHLGLVMVKDPQANWTTIAREGETFSITSDRPLVVEVYGEVHGSDPVHLLSRDGGIENSPVAGQQYVAWQLEQIAPQSCHLFLPVIYR